MIAWISSIDWKFVAEVVLIGGGIGGPILTYTYLGILDDREQEAARRDRIEREANPWA